jgi:Ca2+:H+ antiporter
MPWEGPSITYLLLLIPLSLALAYWHAPSIWVFAAAGVAIVPLAEWIRRATEQMAALFGPAIGGLLNVTFGNVAELVLALFVLRAGTTGVVKATITGSIIGNSLLGLGAAILVGGWGREKQVFKRERAGLLGNLLILSMIALLLPALFNYTQQGRIPPAAARLSNEQLSLGASVVLILAYAGNLVYTLVTHRDVYASHQEKEKADWSLWQALAILLLGTAAVALEADLVADNLTPTARSLGLSELFVGVVLLPLAGNAAEYFAAVSFARQDRMGLVMSIAVGSSIQVALLTAPVLVILSFLLGHPMNLVFSSPLDLIAIAGTALAVNSVAHDGETNWFEGLLLITVYVLMALAFYFIRA